MTSDKLIVFDLDFTLWDCGGTWCDCTDPPFTLLNDRVTDRRGRWIRLYPHVSNLLDRCDQAGIQMALASRTEQPSWARQLLDLLSVRHRFAFEEIYPSSKLKHFDALRRASGVAYEQMLFFDDEMRNIHEVSQLGVNSIYVEDGINQSLFSQHFEAFAQS